MKYLFACLTIMLSACSTVAINGIYAEPPNRHCTFVKYQRAHEEESCWCAVEGRTEDEADAILMVKVPNKYCAGDVK